MGRAAAREWRPFGRHVQPRVVDSGTAACRPERGGRAGGRRDRARCGRHCRSPRQESRAPATSSLGGGRPALGQGWSASALRSEPFRGTPTRALQQHTARQRVAVLNGDRRRAAPLSAAKQRLCAAAASRAARTRVHEASCERERPMPIRGSGPGRDAQRDALVNDARSTIKKKINRSGDATLRLASPFAPAAGFRLSRWAARLGQPRSPAIGGVQWPRRGTVDADDGVYRETTDALKVGRPACGGWAWPSLPGSLPCPPSSAIRFLAVGSLAALCPARPPGVLVFAG
jgi:hypothetical protein